MNLVNGKSTPHRARRIAVPVALVAGGLLAGGVLAGTLTASADTTTSEGSKPSTSSSSSGPSDHAAGPRRNRTVDESKSQRSDEKLLTGDTADKVRAAALAKYPGATILRVETDSDGVYEAHLTTGAGKRVTVEVGKGFTVTGEEAGGPGAGRGGPGGQAGGKHGPGQGMPNGQAPPQGQAPAGGQAAPGA